MNTPQRASDNTLLRRLAAWYTYGHLDTTECANLVWACRSSAQFGPAGLVLALAWLVPLSLLFVSLIIVPKLSLLQGAQHSSVQKLLVR